MYIVRRWVTRNARSFEVFYRLTARVFHALDPLWAGLHRTPLERPFTAVEAWCKGILFDCRMCGRCRLSVTGMTCVMNCPKTIANGPCGGVREDGHCEVEPDMRCVWVEAWSGAQRMRGGMAIRTPQVPLNHAIDGTSAWLRLSTENLERRRDAVRRDAEGAS